MAYALCRRNMMAYALCRRKVMAYALCRRNMMAYALCRRNMMAYALCRRKVMAYALCRRKVMAYALCRRKVMAYAASHGGRSASAVDAEEGWREGSPCWLDWLGRHDCSEGGWPEGGLPSPECGGAHAPAKSRRVHRRGRLCCRGA